MNLFGNKTEKQPDLIAFVIYDSKGKQYGVPQFAPNALSLIREYESQWDDMVKNRSMLASHSEDYFIFQVGTYDRITGRLEAMDPQSVVGFHEIRSTVTNRYGAQTLPTPLRDVGQANQQ